MRLEPFERPVFARARRMCLAFPETTETVSWGHPSFRAGRKTFCTFEMVGGRPSIAFRLPTEEVERMLKRHTRIIASPYGRGRWISVWVDGKVDWKLIESALDRSYRTVTATRAGRAG